MKKSFLFSIPLFMLLFATSIFAQTHNTGSLQVGVVPQAFIGHGDGGAGGTGVKFNGNTNDAMFTAGLIYGTSATSVRGSIGSFTSSDTLIVNDFVTVQAPTAIAPLGDYDQHSSQIVKDRELPLNMNVAFESFSNTGDDFVIYKVTFSNNTSTAISGLYTGAFSDWDVGLNDYALNHGGIDGTNKIVYQYGTTAVDMQYYGFVALSNYAGASITTVFPGDGGTTDDIRAALFSWITNNAGTADSTVSGDYRSYLGMGPFNVPANGSAIAGFAMVAGTNLADLQANAVAAKLAWETRATPVELTSFTATTNNGKVVLNWATATETNNRGFEIERKSVEGSYSTIAFIGGKGTTTQAQNYSYTDNSTSTGTYTYRLKQVDFNGKFEYSSEVEALIAPSAFSLEQNYPNPFNPSTVIKFNMPEAGNVRLAVYNLLGEQVALLANGNYEAGTHEVSFNANNLSTGAYFYKIESGSNVQVKKMLLTK